MMITTWLEGEAEDGILLRRMSRASSRHTAHWCSSGVSREECDGEDEMRWYRYVSVIAGNNHNHDTGHDET